MDRHAAYTVNGFLFETTFRKSSIAKVIMLSAETNIQNVGQFILF
jgi:hypothetical protein